MALAEVQSAMNFGEHKTLHPFFSKTKRIPSPEKNEQRIEPEQTAFAPETEQTHEGEPNNIDAPPGNKKKRGRKSSKPKESGCNGSVKSKQASLESFTQRPKIVSSEKEPGISNASGDNKPTITASVAGYEPSLVEDPNADRRKRRKTASPPPKAIHLSEPSAVGLEPNAHDITEPSLPPWHEQLIAEATKSDTVLVETSSPRYEPPRLLPRQEEAVPNTPKIVDDDAVIPSSPPLPSAQPLDIPRTLDIETTPGGEKENESEKEARPKAISPKKKQLRINSKGRFSSPVSKDTKEATGPKRPLRRKAARKSQQTTATILKYGADLESRISFGNKINQILDSKKGGENESPKPKANPRKPKGSPKPTHPFFLGQALEKKEEQTPIKEPTQQALLQPPKTPRRSAVTPGKLRAEAQANRSPSKTVAFGPIPGESKVTKYPGQVDAPWPSKLTSHVRGLEGGEKEGVLWSQSIDSGSESFPRVRKLKSALAAVSNDENILLRASQHQSQRSDDSSAEREHLEAFRVPERLLTTGVDVAKMVCQELHTQILGPGREDAAAQKVHPALMALFSSIENTLTPFDKGECEPLAWTQKYAPTTAAEVLSPGKEAGVIRDWLKSLTVSSVEVSGKLKTRPDSKQKVPKKKRKKDLDDFIVSEGDDSNNEDMDELTDPEDATASNSRLGMRRSVVRAGRHDNSDDPRSKRKNAIILSGPHGCGKTATVYAVAKELGFEVFELNPGTRRSGKDILDKVGDMSENHLVNHKSGEHKLAPIPTEVVDPEQDRMAEALQKDLESGRQGTMTSFFMPKAQVKTQAKPKVKPIATKAPKSTKASANIQSTISKPQNQSQNQKQSLILLEEVDILFKEDESFWATVIKLATQSKRPIIMTCSNESLVALQALPLHAILRLYPPPVDLAADYLLLLAAKEGHLLERKAASDLYRSKDHDLRASITELDFWCQMSVGDRKGGLEWIYQRWPPGKEFDEHGRILRVASKGTYQSGMGWLSHDVIQSNDCLAFDKEEELLTEAWGMWGISPECWAHPPLDVQPMPSGSAVRRNIKTLQQLEGLLECVSAADIYCRVGLPFNDMDPMDPTQPLMPRNGALNFTDVHTLLQADPLEDPTAFAEKLYVRTHLAAQRAAASYSLSYFEDIRTTYYSDPSALETYTGAILAHKASARTTNDLTRWDFAEALDPLAVPPTNALTHAMPSSLIASSFDREFRVIVEDLAPYARSIVKHEQKLEIARVRMSNLLSEGGRAKRQRMSRASRSALEGGKREEKRRERWFTKELNMELVMATGGKSWAGMGTEVESLASESRRSGSVRTIISEDEE